MSWSGMTREQRTEAIHRLREAAERRFPVSGSTGP